MGPYTLPIPPTAEAPPGAGAPPDPWPKPLPPIPFAADAPESPLGPLGEPLTPQLLLQASLPVSRLLLLPHASVQKSAQPTAMEILTHTRVRRWLVAASGLASAGQGDPCVCVCVRLDGNRDAAIQPA